MSSSTSSSFEVRKITGMALRVRGRWSSSMPSMRGIFTSSTARSTGRAVRPCSALSPSV